MSKKRVEKVLNGDNIKVLKDFPDNYFDSIVTDPPYGISFMGKKWDYDVPSVETWEEVFRVLKPGGHMLVACGTRTQHRMAVNIEDAGFEIRDIVAWVYGSGFPKSHDISKAIDKDNGVWRGKAGKIISENNSMTAPNYERTDKGQPISDDAKKWQGWGTALKPSMELWTLARKPIDQDTIAKNVLKYGTGGINIDASRVATDETLQPSSSTKMKYGGNSFNESSTMNDPNWVQNQNGRFPANLIHDGSEEVVKLFPNTQSSAGSFKASDYKQGDGVTSFTRGDFEGYGDSGSAARFFYVAKASQKERNFGLYDFEEVSGGSYEFRQDGSLDGKIPKRKNIHPTVKPIELMRYLVRMITPPNGIVLDLYAGSGSTLIGAKQEKFQYVGIELDKDYYEIAKARVEAEVVKYDIFDF